MSAISLLAAAKAEYEWFYWLAPLLMFGAVAMVIALWGGYIKKVFVPRHRGRRVEE